MRIGYERRNKSFPQVKGGYSNTPEIHGEHGMTWKSRGVNGLVCLKLRMLWKWYGKFCCKGGQEPGHQRPWMPCWGGDLWRTWPDTEMEAFPLPTVLPAHTTPSENTLVFCHHRSGPSQAPQSPQGLFCKIQNTRFIYIPLLYTGMLTGYKL